MTKRSSTKSKTTRRKPAKPRPVDPTYFEMKNPVEIASVPIETKEQERSLGSQIVQAISEGRRFEVRALETGAVLLLVSAADDLGHVYLVDAHGTVRDVGHTEED